MTVQFETSETNTLNNRTLASIIAEFFTEDETKHIIVCDDGNGSSFGDAGRGAEYDPDTMADLIMTDIPDGEDHTSDDGVATTVQSEWQHDVNGYRWRVRF